MFQPTHLVVGSLRERKDIDLHSWLDKDAYWAHYTVVTWRMSNPRICQKWMVKTMPQLLLGVPLDSIVAKQEAVVSWYSWLMRDTHSSSVCPPKPWLCLQPQHQRRIDIDCFSYRPIAVPKTMLMNSLWSSVFLATFAPFPKRNHDRWSFVIWGLGILILWGRNEESLIGPATGVAWVLWVSRISLAVEQIHNWLVVDLPLWKIWVRQLGLFFPIYGKIEMFQTTNQISRYSSPQLY